MIDRTDRPKELNYPRYGGKGIKTWDGWKLKGGVGFLAFKEHLLSLHPDLYDLLDKGYEIDRIDFTGNYEPGNVRIVDPKINDRNKSNNVWVQDLDGTKIAFCDFWEKALSFYSRPETYENPEAVFVFEIPINNDKGAKARKAFEEINDLSLR